MNAGAPAVREPFSYDWFDYDLNFDISFPGAYGGTDFDNRGQRANQQTVDKVDSFLYLNLGAQLQFGELGTSVNAEFLQYSISPAAAGTPGLNLTLGRYHALAAYGLAGNQISIGTGLRGVTAQVSQNASGGPGGQFSSRSLLTMTGVSPEVGAIIKPDNLPWRIGLTARAPVSGKSFGNGAVQEDANGVLRTGNFILPSKVVLPWELEAGFALQLGPRPLNPPWINPHDVERPLDDKIAIARQERAHENALELERLPPGERDKRRAEMVSEERAIREVEDLHIAAESARLRDIRKARYENWPRERLLILVSVLVAGPERSSRRDGGLPRAEARLRRKRPVDRPAPRLRERAHRQFSPRARRQLPRAVALHRRPRAPALHVRRGLPALPVQRLGALRRSGVARELLRGPRPALRQLGLRHRGVALRSGSSEIT